MLRRNGWQSVERFTNGILGVKRLSGHSLGCGTYLKWKQRLLVVNTNKDFANNKFFTEN